MKKTIMKSERAELSEKNPNYIPAQRYYELKHFCLQYNDWKEALKRIDSWGTTAPNISGIAKGTEPSNPTERTALARLYYSTHIDIVDRCIAKLEPLIAPYILRGITEGVGYEALRANGCPYCRESYYQYYRYFFWLLSKERQ